MHAAQVNSTALPYCPPAVLHCDACLGHNTHNLAHVLFNYMPLLMLHLPSHTCSLTSAASTAPAALLLPPTTCCCAAYMCCSAAVVRSTLGAAAADQLLGEHAGMKSMLATLDTMAVSDPSFDMQLRGTMDATMAHMQVRRRVECVQCARVWGLLLSIRQLHVAC